MTRIHSLASLGLAAVLLALLALAAALPACTGSGSLVLDDDDSAADDDDATDDDDAADDDATDDDDDDSPWEGTWAGEAVLITEGWGGEPYELCSGEIELEIDAAGLLSGGGTCWMNWGGGDPGEGRGGGDQGIVLSFEGQADDDGGASGDIVHEVPYNEEPLVFPFEGEHDGGWDFRWQGAYQTNWNTVEFVGEAWADPADR